MRDLLLCALKLIKTRSDRVWSVHGLGSFFVVFLTSGSMRTQVSVFRRGHPLTSSQTVLTTFFDFCPFPATFEADFRGLSKACILRKSSGLSRSKYSSCNALSLKNKNFVSHQMTMPLRGWKNTLGHQQMYDFERIYDTKVGFLRVRTRTNRTNLSCYFPCFLCPKIHTIKFTLLVVSCTQLPVPTVVEVLFTAEYKLQSTENLDLLR